MALRGSGTTCSSPARKTPARAVVTVAPDVRGLSHVEGFAIRSGGASDPPAAAPRDANRPSTPTTTDNTTSGAYAQEYSAPKASAPQASSVTAALGNSRLRGEWFVPGV